MRKGNHRRTKHAQKYTILCEWCKERRETAREDTKTCGDRCRARLNAFVTRFGYEPLEMPGPVTAGEAIRDELERLIREERTRQRASQLLNGHR